MQIDVVLPVALKDLSKLSLCVAKVVAHSLTPIRNIYVVCQSATFVEHLSSEHPIVWVSEAAYPFTEYDVHTIIQETGTNRSARSGWYYQQLLKLYVFRAIPELLPNVLVLDVDYLFTKELAFLTADGKAILAAGYPFEWLFDTRHYPLPTHHWYVRFAQWLIPSWRPVGVYTGIQHHALMQKNIVDEIFQIVEDTHQKPLWRAFASHGEGTPSEYALYYHFALGRHGQNVTTRHLKACDYIYDSNDTDYLLEELVQHTDFQAVGYHQTQLDMRAWLAQASHLPTDLKAAIKASEVPAFRLILEGGVLHMEEVSLSDSNRLYLQSGMRRNFARQLQWLAALGDPSVLTGSKLLVFLRPASPACTQWLNLLKVVHRRCDLPAIIGILAGVSQVERDEFAEAYALNFPIRTIENTELNSLGIYSLPTAFLLADGIIQDKWVVRMPAAFTTRIRQGDMRYLLGPAQVG